MQVLRRGTFGRKPNEACWVKDGPSGAMPERGELSAAKPGCRARFLFGYFLFCARKEKVTRRGAKPVVAMQQCRRVTRSKLAQHLTGT